MDAPSTRRRALQLGATAATVGIAGCLGSDPVEGTLDFDGIDEIDETALPSLTRYATMEEPFQHYREYPADDAETALILLHTAGFDSRLLQPVATALAAADIAHVYTPDLRGHGPDPEVRGDIQHIHQYRDDLRRMVDRVEMIHPDADIIVGGHGTGGGIVALFASTHYSSLVDGYVLCAPYFNRSEPTARPAAGGWADYYSDRIFMLNVFTGFGLENYSEMVSVEYDIPDGVWDGTETPAHSYRLMRSYTPTEGVVSEFADTPCLTLVGDADESVYPSEFEPLFADLPNATVDVLDGVSHLELVVGESAVDPIDNWIRSL